MIQHGFTKSTIEKAVEDSGISFRERFMPVFVLLGSKYVSTLIFSAGLYDVIHAVLNKEYKKTPAQKPPKSVHVISNMMQFDESGKPLLYVARYDNIGRVYGSLTKVANYCFITAHSQHEQECVCSGWHTLLEAVPARRAPQHSAFG
ncbi:hypothetical protein ON010_g9960 [Phytophthora cinnamomi]|nr:hypothetical protein ON010_g9960 [Phytophthora cinnamomi]